MAKKETAEEKLLKIIEATKKAKGLSPAGPATSSLPRTSARKFSVSLQQVNAVLIAAVLAAFLFLIYEIRSGLVLLREDVAISVDAAAPRNPGDIALPQVRDVAYYLEKVEQRNIFQPFVKKSEGEQAKAPAPDGLQTKMSKYKLVGVAWLDVPESATAMLEDTGKHETHFLREGDKIEDVKVKTIYTDRVVFSYANEEMTIKL